MSFQPDNHETPVLFRAERCAKPYVTAVFPCEPSDTAGYNMACYAHIGQHSSCCSSWYAGTRAATPEEYADLQRELEGAPYGYRLKIYKRIQPWMRKARFAASCIDQLCT